MYSTVGVHPTRSLEFLPDDERAQITSLMEALSDASQAASVAEREAAVLRDSLLASQVKMANPRAHARDPQAAACADAAALLSPDRAHCSTAGQRTRGSGGGGRGEGARGRARGGGCGHEGRHEHSAFTAL